MQLRACCGTPWSYSHILHHHSSKPLRLSHSSRLHYYTHIHTHIYCHPLCGKSRPFPLNNPTSRGEVAAALIRRPFVLLLLLLLLLLLFPPIDGLRLLLEDCADPSSSR